MTTPTMHTYSQTPTDVVRAASGIDFAYRRVGNRGDIPLVLANYFAANMDDWDPLIVDGLAADRDVITFDYPGIGSSAGATPATVAEFAVDCVGFLHALDLTTVDFLGFSLGGMVAQQIASSHPEMFRRMILCGTGPRGGEKMTFTELSIDELNDPVALLLNSFFTPSDASQPAGHAYLDRLNRREADSQSLDHAGVDLDAAGGRVTAHSVGILRHQLHIHEWRFAGFVEMLAGMHRVVPVAGHLLGDRPRSRRCLMTAHSRHT